jgi:hypothetical protein
VSNEMLFIIAVVVSFATGVSATLFTINVRYLLKHRPRYKRRHRELIRAMEGSGYTRILKK